MQPTQYGHSRKHLRDYLCNCTQEKCRISLQGMRCVRRDYWNKGRSSLCLHAIDTLRCSSRVSPRRSDQLCRRGCRLGIEENNHGQMRHQRKKILWSCTSYQNWWTHWLRAGRGQGQSKQLWPALGARRMYMDGAKLDNDHNKIMLIFVDINDSNWIFWWIKNIHVCL